MTGLDHSALTDPTCIAWLAKRKVTVQELGRPFAIRLLVMRRHLNLLQEAGLGGVCMDAAAPCAGWGMPVRTHRPTRARPEPTSWSGSRA